jgi:uncharacterized OB-fold protein
VVATNCTQEYSRYLKPGDRLTVESSIESFSEEKQTALGSGHFITQKIVYRDQTGAIVGTQLFRMLKFKPRALPAQMPAAPRAFPRPKAAITRDNQFFWDGIAKRELRIQRCNGCGRLQHPPGPMCPSCHGLDLGYVVAKGRGTLYSYVVAHHPPIPPFEYPNLIGLIALEEGTRLVSNLAGVTREDVRIGMPLELEFAEVEPGRVLPRFKPAAA